MPPPTRNKIYLGHHVKCLIFFHNFKNILEFREGFSKEALNIKFHVIPSSTSRNVTCGQMDRLTAGGQTDGRL